METILHYFYLLLSNLDYLVILALVFIATASVVIGLAILILGKNEVQQRLTRLMPGRPQPIKSTEPTSKLIDNEPPSGPLARFTKPLHQIIAPREGATRRALRLKLIRAGYRSELAQYNYLTTKVALALLLPGIYAFTRFFYKLTPQILLICIVLAVIGFFLPNLVLWMITSSRQERLVKGLPDALDLMVVCVEAGYGLDMTFKRVGDEIRPLCKDLSDEFYLTTMEIRAGRSREESFKEMATRTGVAEVHSLMTMLVQTSRFGTSLAKALRVHADAMRVKRRQQAEEKAAKASVKLVFPLVLFIFPALMIVLAGPAAIRIATVLFPAMTR